MPVTPWTLPGTVTGTSWAASDAGTLLNAVTIDDTVYAVHAAPVTDPLICSNFAFALLSTDVPEGIEINIKCMCDAPIIKPGPDAGVAIRGTADAVSFVGNNFELSPVAGPPTQTEFTVGGPTDLGGYAYTGTEVGGSGFGFGIKASSVNAEVPARGRRVYYVRARVYYSNGGVGSGASALMCGRFIRLPNFGQISEHFESTSRKN